LVSADAWRTGARFVFKRLAMTDQEKITERLWAIINELTEINEYEYPYRIPMLQKKADVIKRLTQPPPDDDAA